MQQSCYPLFWKHDATWSRAWESVGKHNKTNHPIERQQSRLWSASCWTLWSSPNCYPHRYSALQFEAEELIAVFPEYALNLLLQRDLPKVAPTLRELSAECINAMSSYAPRIVADIVIPLLISGFEEENYDWRKRERVVHLSGKCFV